MKLEVARSVVTSNGLNTATAFSTVPLISHGCRQWVRAPLRRTILPSEIHEITPTLRPQGPTQGCVVCGSVAALLNDPLQHDPHKQHPANALAIVGRAMHWLEACTEEGVCLKPYVYKLFTQISSNLRNRTGISASKAESCHIDLSGP